VSARFLKSVQPGFKTASPTLLPLSQSSLYPIPLMYARARATGLAIMISLRSILPPAIHSPPQSAPSSNAISNVPTSLHGPSRPSLSHVFTFQKHFCAVFNGLPAYGTLTDCSESTLPESHKSPRSPSSSSLPLATTIRYALCNSPRSGWLKHHEKRGFRTSMPNGFTAYSQRSLNTFINPSPRSALFLATVAYEVAAHANVNVVTSNSILTTS